MASCAGAYSAVLSCSFYLATLSQLWTFYAFSPSVALLSSLTPFGLNVLALNTCNVCMPYWRSLRRMHPMSKRLLHRAILHSSEMQGA